MQITCEVLDELVNRALRRSPAEPCHNVVLPRCTAKFLDSMDALSRQTLHVPDLYGIISQGGRLGIK